MIRPLALAAALAVAAAPVVAHELTAGPLKLSKLHVRAPIGNVKNTAAYVVVANPTAQADRLVSASCACADSVTLHDINMAGGIMRMRAAPQGFEVPAGGTLVLAPGGKHVMLTGLNRALKDGDRVDLTLRFARAGTVKADFHVMTRPGGDDPKPADASGHDHH